MSDLEPYPCPKCRRQVIKNENIVNKFGGPTIMDLITREPHWKICENNARQRPIAVDNNERLAKFFEPWVVGDKGVPLTAEEKKILFKKYEGPVRYEL